MKWKICFLIRLHTARRAVCFSPSSGMSAAVHSRHCMADMLSR